MAVGASDAVADCAKEGYESGRHDQYPREVARRLRDEAGAGCESQRLLDLYDRQRRTVAVEFVQEQSIANKKRLEAADPQQRRRNLDDLRAIAADPARARQFLLRSAMIDSQRRADSIALEDA